MRCTVRDSFAVDETTFWRKLFFDHRFVDRLYMEALGCKRVDYVSESGDLDSVLTRRIRFVQPVDAPAPVRKLFGETTTMEEDGRFDAKSGRWTFRMIPEKMADKISINGETWLEKEGDGKVARVCQVDFAVSIFGIGSLVEKFMAKQTQESWEKQARFLRAYIAENEL
jgi:hypothetical protein